MRHERKLLALPALAALLALAASGCIFSPDDDGGGGGTPPPPRPFPDSADQVMANFRSAYTAMDIDYYNDVLHNDYRFLFKPEDAASLPTSFYTKAEEMEATENMFSGEAHQRPDGGSEPGISGITIGTWIRQGLWTDIGPNDPDFPNTRRAVYEVALDFARAGFSTIQVRGQQEFYVSSRDSLVNGVTLQFYQVRGQRDLTNSN
jgi:hypothetical protein